NLFLASQVLELNMPSLVVLTMVDLAERHGRPVDVARLADRLGIPVIPLNARTGAGRAELLAAIAEAIGAPGAASPLAWPEGFEAQARALAGAMCLDAREARNVGTARRLLLDDESLAGAHLQRTCGENAVQALHACRQALVAARLVPAEIEAELRYPWCGDVAADCRASDAAVRRRRKSERVDNLLTHRVFGTLIFIVVMGAVFVSVFSWAAPLMDAVDAGFSALAGAVRSWLGDTVMASFLADGVVTGVGGVLVFLPQILILIALVTVLEDCGYLARAAFLMDRVMRVFGLGGRSFVPLLSSFACAIPGIMAARTVGSQRDRLLTILVAPLMPCSARIPVYTLLVLAFVPARTVLGFLPLQGLVFCAVYGFGVVVAALVAIVLKKTVLRGENAPFLLELPGYKRPSLRTIGLRLFDRTRDFVTTAGTIILAMSVIIWALGYFPRPAGVAQRVQADLAAQGVTEPAAVAHAVDGAYLRQSYLARLGRTIEPVVHPLGWDWRIGTAVLAAFPAREVVVSTMGIIYNLGPETSEDATALHEKLHAAKWPDGSRVFTVPVAVSLMVFFALCCQCQATVAVIRRETNSWKWAAFAFSYMTVLAYVAAFLVYQIGSRIA
ncbi:MAG TPA: ferrous iron transport protein B, partial [Phycisphaerae bacterium]|nr:ferrous iron transport protein B [Phycisphaerae bacterium]